MYRVAVQSNVQQAGVNPAQPSGHRDLVDLGRPPSSRNEPQTPSTAHNPSIDGQMSKRIAVIGGGAAGLAAGYLLRREFELTLFEKEPRLGGNAYTYTARDGQQLDIAVAAFGRAGYEHFFRLLAELGIVTRSSAGAYMSFHDLDTQQGIYVTPSLRGLRAQRFRILRPSQLRPFWELSRGLAAARRIQKEGGFGDLTVREGLRLLPRISGDAETIFICALCLLSSMSAEEVLEAPARFFFGKIAVHNDVISPKAIYSVRTLPGGTRSYVSALARAFGDRIVRSARIRAVRRDDDRIRIAFSGGGEATFDKVIFACNADQVAGSARGADAARAGAALRLALQGRPAGGAPGLHRIPEAGAHAGLHLPLPTAGRRLLDLGERELCGSSHPSRTRAT